MKLYGATPSPFFRKARVVLEEKGLSYETEDLAPFPKTPELMAMHPMGKIPILKDGDATIPDSSVICAYIERTHPTPALYPADAVEFARALFLEEYADTRIAEVVGGIFFERFVKPNVFQQDTDEARVSEIIENDLPPLLDWLEAQVPESGDSVLSHFSIADVALAAHMGGLRFANVPLDAERWPKLGRYCEAVWSRPSFKAAMAMG